MDKQSVVIVAVAVSFLSFFALLIYTAMPGPRPVPVYQSGQFVKSVLSGKRGQVVRAKCYPGTNACNYVVRFVGLSMTTQTSILGPDGPISTEPLNMVELHEFEITAD